MNALVGAVIAGGAVVFVMCLSYLVGLRTGEHRGETNEKRRQNAKPFGAGLPRVEP